MGKIDFFFLKRKGKKKKKLSSSQVYSPDGILPILFFVFFFGFGFAHKEMNRSFMWVDGSTST